jgi:hypothetical protein
MRVIHSVGVDKDATHIVLKVTAAEGLLEGPVSVPRAEIEALDALKDDKERLARLDALIGADPRFSDAAEAAILAVKQPRLTAEKEMAALAGKLTRMLWPPVEMPPKAIIH